MNTPAALPDATRLAVDRTRLAHERTLMAWVRTSTSLISFGFTIYKFFEFLQSSGQRQMADHLIGPTEFAGGMIALGVIALGLATLEHRRQLRQLSVHYGPEPASYAMWLAAVVFLLGMVGLFAVVFRL
jgi:putative membrane protein